MWLIVFRFVCLVMRLLILYIMLWLLFVFMILKGVDWIVLMCSGLVVCVGVLVSV